MARPKKNIRRDKGLRIRLTDNDYDVIRSRAKELGISMSEYMRMCVNNELSPCRDIFEEMERRNDATVVRF